MITILNKIYELVGYWIGYRII